MATRGAIIARIAMNLAGGSFLKAIYAPAAATGVARVPDSLTSTPCALFLPGESPVIPGNWERQTWAIRGSIWTADKPRGEKLEALANFTDDVLAAFRVPDVTAVDPAVQSLVLLSFDPIVRQQYQEGEGMPWYLVLPFTLEAKVNRSVVYGPA